ncbi:translation initiation factor IF-3 [Paenibacillus sp. 598K]|uniref:translation initiation factor IF-3 n=1 Tax=Paenibacillus sp. 598K TaxID=1117987 RepID=UPI000FFABDDC|nr:translation initiation factor IF-3 [Paenibacillus sp. 598K]GBF73587.1 translation initiation factor IF-3 [Paenibacillus sp. 598K]
MLKNEKIRAAEVLLTGIGGEPLGVVSRDEALALARQAKADLVCDTLMSSPPPCRLVARGQAKQQAPLTQRSPGAERKVKEIRLTAAIEEHDYDTKQRQAAKLLQAGHLAQLVVKLQGRKGESEQAKALLQRLLADLREIGKAQSGIQMSGKQAAVTVEPLQ